MPPALAAWLARLRADAASAGPLDLVRVLNNERGERFVLLKQEIEAHETDAALWAHVVERFKGN